MTGSDFLFDTWAWWEYLHGTPTGASLRKRFIQEESVRVHTSAITIAEISARLQADGFPDRIAAACGAIRRMSHLWDVTADLAQEAGPVRAKLRDRSRSASLADALVLVTARKAGATLVSADPAFRDVTGVIIG